MSQGKKPTILLIEADASLRRLITLGLQQHGMYVIEASSAASVASLNIQELDMLVLDVDRGVYSDWSLVEAARQYPHFTDVPAVVLSWECLIPSHLHTATLSPTLEPEQIICLTKPFDARILYATVEQLLTARAAREAVAVARAEAVLLAAYSAQAAPSIWPMITAAGVLLVFIGMMLQIAVTVAGILLVMVALLLWTLGTKPTAMHPCEV
jgi:CheY-like chemotaxis protein